MSAARRVVLCQRPVGMPDAETFGVEEFTLAEPTEGEFLVRVEMLSLAPAMRGWLDETPTYREPLELGEPIPGRGLATVTDSRNPDYPVGSVVVGPFGMSTGALSDGTNVVVCDLESAPAATWMGLLDTNGLTAYFGLLSVGKMQAGDTVVISGAAGGVGSVAVQLARLAGAATVIAIAGGPTQCAWLVDELGADVAIDYRAEDVASALAVHAPAGIDVYFDNVGGEILEAALANLAVGARVALCGAISMYNQPGARTGPSNYLELLFKRASLIGFITTDFDTEFDTARRELAQWHSEGRMIAREHVLDGELDDFPRVFNRLFEGEKPGKLVLRLGSL